LIQRQLRIDARVHKCEFPVDYHPIGILQNFQMAGILLAKVRSHVFQSSESFQSVRNIGFITSGSFEPTGAPSWIDGFNSHEFQQEIIMVAGA
jgi:hypothetical protein